MLSLRNLVFIIPKYIFSFLLFSCNVETKTDKTDINYENSNYTQLYLEHNNGNEQHYKKRLFVITKDSLHIGIYENYEKKNIIRFKLSDTISRIITDAFIKKIDPVFYKETRLNQGNKDTAPFVTFYLKGYKNEYGYKNKQATYYNVNDLYIFIPELENVLKELKIDIISDENLCCF